MFVSGATGPMHVAAAAGTRCVCFFSHVPVLSETRWAPWMTEYVVLKPPEKCAHRPDSCRCMDTIPVDDIIKAVMGFINGSKKT